MPKVPANRNFPIITEPLAKRRPVQSSSAHNAMPRVRNLIGFSVLITLIFCVVVIYQSTRSYHETLKQTKDTAARMVHTLADHVELTFMGADLSLRRAIERQYFHTLFGDAPNSKTEQNFTFWLKETPQIAAIALINAKGEVQAGAAKPGLEKWLQGQTSANSSFFITMRGTEERPVTIRSYDLPGKEPLIVISRRYELMNGQFGGIVVAALPANYFLDYYRSIAPGRSPFMALSSAGHVLILGPALAEQNRKLIEIAPVPPPGSQDVALQTVLSSGNNTLKIMASRSLANLPLTVNVSIEDDDIFADWRQMRAKDIGFLVLFVVFASVITFFSFAMARHIMRAEESENAAIMASQAKSEFLANMSHELRTPLNAIIGFSEMINSGYFGPLTPKQRERIHDINLCGTHLLQLINDILEFSKGEAGKLELVEEKVDLGEIIDECLRIVSGRIKSKHIRAVADVMPDMPLLWGDKRKIRQVLLNLLSNAVKFTPEAGVIRVTGRIDANNAMHMIVADTGIGIPEDDISKALSVFGQVHRSQSHEGTGLGLPLCKMYAELHGGKLVLSSRVGEGTTVRISFPHQRTLARKEV